MFDPVYKSVKRKHSYWKMIREEEGRLDGINYNW